MDLSFFEYVKEYVSPIWKPIKAKGFPGFYTRLKPCFYLQSIIC